MPYYIAQIDAGTRFGRLVVTGPVVLVPRSDGRNRSKYPCLCDCGNEKFVLSGNLLSGNTVSCGCFQKERASQSNTTHGQTRTVLYRRWKSMHERCSNPNSSRYKWYGARGIQVCPEWSDFSVYAEWATASGFAPIMELDRIDNDGPYSPDNCRWVTKTTNLMNRRGYLEPELESKLKQAAQTKGVPVETIIKQALVSYLA